MLYLILIDPWVSKASFYLFLPGGVDLQALDV